MVMVPENVNSTANNGINWETSIHRIVAEVVQKSLPHHVPFISSLLYCVYIQVLYPMHLDLSHCVYNDLKIIVDNPKPNTT